jgi:CheY-like chemotaxis protein
MFDTPNLNSIADSNPQLKQQKTVLIVGPNDELSSQIATTLPGWNIERAENNLGALGMTQRHSFDLIITGQNTSGAADVELLRKIRRVRPHVRLLILTNESTPSDAITSMREGAFSPPFIWLVHRNDSTRSESTMLGRRNRGDLSNAGVDPAGGPLRQTHCRPAYSVLP